MSGLAHKQFMIVRCVRSIVRELRTLGVNFTYTRFIPRDFVMYNGPVKV